MILVIIVPGSMPVATLAGGLSSLTLLSTTVYG